MRESQTQPANSHHFSPSSSVISNGSATFLKDSGPPSMREPSLSRTWANTGALDHGNGGPSECDAVTRDRGLESLPGAELCDEGVTTTRASSSERAASSLLKSGDGEVV